MHQALLPLSPTNRKKSSVPPLMYRAFSLSAKVVKGFKTFKNNVLEIEEIIRLFESDATGEILKTQTTYFDAVCYSQSESHLSQDNFRVHFRSKRYFSLGRGKFFSFRLFEKHPLLLRYAEPLVSVHLASLVSDRQMFCEELDLVANKIYGSWRSVEDFCSPPSDWTLEKPYGILMEAPLSYAEAVVEAAERIGVDLFIRNYHKKRDENMPRVFVLDDWFVIADDFRVERIK
jgi:hypothetical protein